MELRAAPMRLLLLFCLLSPASSSSALFTASSPILGLAADPPSGHLYVATADHLLKLHQESCLGDATSASCLVRKVERETAELRSFRFERDGDAEASLSLCDGQQCQSFDEDLELLDSVSLGALAKDEPFTYLLRNGSTSFLGGRHMDWTDVKLPDDMIGATRTSRNKGIYGVELRSEDLDGPAKAPEYGPREEFFFYNGLEGERSSEVYPDGIPVAYLGSFAHQGNLYFLRNVHKEVKSKMSLGSSQEDPLPDEVERRTSVQIAQVLAEDSFLASGGDPDKDESFPTWVNLELKCGPDPVKPIAARSFVFLRDKDPSLVLYAEQDGSHQLCRFFMKALENEFTKVFDSCQSRTASKINTPFDVVSRGPDGAFYCVKRDCFGSGKKSRTAPKVRSDCTANMRLDSFIPVLPSSTTANLTLASPIVRLLPGDSAASVLGLTAGGSVHKAQFFDDPNRVAPAPEFPVPGLPPLGPFRTAADALRVASMDGRLFVAEGDGGIWAQSLACEGLLLKCADAQSSQYQSFLHNDPQKCVWCTAKDGKGEGLPRDLCPPERHPLRSVCPPAVHGVSVNKEGSLSIKGELDGLRLASVTVCGEPCVTQASRSYELVCRFELTKPPKDCAVLLRGAYGKANYSFELRKSVSLAGPSSGLNTQGAEEGASTATMAFVGVGLGALLCCSLICAVLLLRRRRLEKRRQRDNSSLAPLPMDLRRTGNTYGGHALVPQLSTEPPPYEDMTYLVPEKLRIPYASVDIASEIGSGHFGKVFKAIFVRPAQPPLTVAVKTLNSPSGVREFLKEGLRMENFEHERVMGLLGITFDPDNNYPMIVTPFMPRGDLLTYLQNPSNAPTLRNLLRFCVEIAEGMAYLHKIKFIHRDLAARNCMLDESLHIRIADFGLSRDVYNEDGAYVPSTERFMPLRWLAPEAIERWTFTYKGDVWAYGVTVWEISTRGLVPYSHLLSGFEVCSFLKGGERLPKPQFFPDALYELMLDCWAHQPQDRPSFPDLCLRVPGIVERMETEGHKSLEVPLHHSYVNVNYGPSLHSPSQSQML